MDFTREPVVETVITPREGCKLVIRSSKGASQEEYFVDAVEVVSFGSAFFFRSIEKPKSFLLPVVDYEVLEVREARIMLKHSSSSGEKAIKIGKKEQPKEEKKPPKQREELPKPERKRERKKHGRRGRGGDKESRPRDEENPSDPHEERHLELGEGEDKPSTSSIIRSLLSPPPLISETIGHYRETYSQAFFDSDESEEEESGSFLEEEEESPLVGIEETSESQENSSKKDLWNFTD